MFIKSLKIESSAGVIRDITFVKGINLIVDETKTEDRRESGNNVGKTTVLRLIDFCLGGDGKSIYQDSEFRSKSNSMVEEFLKSKNVVVTLALKSDLDNDESSEVVIRRNFLPRSDKVQEINGEDYGNRDFPKKLKELIFWSSSDKPTFRQIIAKNVRDEKNRLVNTVRVLHANTTKEEYEAVFLFWLGIDINVSERKQRLLGKIKNETSLQDRLKKEGSLSQIMQSLLVVNRNIERLTKRKDIFNINENYEADIAQLNKVKSEISSLSTYLGQMELRRALIEESKEELEKEYASINLVKIRKLYGEAKKLLPEIQRTFEETVEFHNGMIAEKIKYIGEELPSLNEDIASKKRQLNSLLASEKKLSGVVKKSGVIEELEEIVSELNSAHEAKGALNEQERLWRESNERLSVINDELQTINEGIDSLDENIQANVGRFNEFFSNMSERLYGEQFVLSADKNDKGYELNISTLGGNLGTGKKKGQMAAFDLAYIQFADDEDIRCLHFILQDQVENIHDNQITNLLTEIVNDVSCQYVLPVLRDKLPSDIDVSQYEILSLAQNDKLFKF